MCTNTVNADLFIPTAFSVPSVPSSGFFNFFNCTEQKRASWCSEITPLWSPCSLQSRSLRGSGAPSEARWTGFISSWSKMSCWKKPWGPHLLNAALCVHPAPELQAGTSAVIGQTTKLQVNWRLFVRGVALFEVNSRGPEKNRFALSFSWGDELPTKSWKTF